MAACPSAEQNHSAGLYLLSLVARVPGMPVHRTSHGGGILRVFLPVAAASMQSAILPKCAPFPVRPGP